MQTPTVPIIISPQAAHLTHMARLPASNLPHALSFDEAADIISRRSVTACDLSIGATGLWILDPSAQLGPAPTAKSGHIMNAAAGTPAIAAVSQYLFNIGRDPTRCDVVLPHEYVSGDHIAVTLYEHVVHIENTSKTNGIFVGGGWLGPSKAIRIVPDAPFVFGIANPASAIDGLVLVCPLGDALSDALKSTSQRGVFTTIDRYVLVKREPWQGPVHEKKTMFQAPPRPRGVPLQAADVADRIVTPPQILDTDNFIWSYCDELKNEAALVRQSITDWIKRGNLDRHVEGHQQWDSRLLNNVRQGGILLATHSTDVSGAAAIIKSLNIDPKQSRRKKAFFRYGLGHSYGEIVFVQRPGTTGIGEINDIWDVMKDVTMTRSELYRLVKSVDYNKNVPVKPGKPAMDDPDGRSAMVQYFNEHALMELFPQFESSDPVSLINTYAILVPEHLYESLLDQIPRQFHEWVVRIPGTGPTSKEFLQKLDAVARRTRADGGSYEPKIGRDALFRYELVYFKIVETVLRVRHRALRKRIEEFANAVVRSHLVHPAIVHQIAETTALLPEAFHILHLGKQFPSHDGYSPLGHTMNAVLEAAYLAPRLAQEFESFFAAEVFIALWFHDLGKIYDAKSDDHEKRSLEMAKYHLKMMDVVGDDGTLEQIRNEMILRFIEHADVISEASMALERGENIESIVRQVRRSALSRLPEIFLINFADAASIPGRSGRRMRVKNDYKDVIDVRPKIINTFRQLLKRYDSP